MIYIAANEQKGRRAGLAEVYCQNSATVSTWWIA